jgi:hypothetical protein
MLFFPSLLLVAQAYAQSLVPSISSDSRTNTCLRRSFYVYTQDSSTYVVSNLGSTSFPPGPSLCPNVSVSTVLSNRTITKALPASTVTVYQQPTGTAPTVITDAGFEDGQNSPFNTSASNPQVSAAVTQAGSGPLQPYSGNSYLYVLNAFD